MCWFPNAAYISSTRSNDTYIHVIDALIELMLECIDLIYSNIPLIHLPLHVLSNLFYYILLKDSSCYIDYVSNHSPYEEWQRRIPCQEIAHQPRPPATKQIFHVDPHEHLREIFLQHPCSPHGYHARLDYN